MLYYRFYSFLLFFSGFYLSAFAQNKDSLTLRYSGEIYFAFGKHDLQLASDSVFQKAAFHFHKNEEMSIRITAHTDAIGQNQSNYLLSQKRGNAVQNKLLALDVPVEKMSVRVYGEEHPIANNDDAIGRQRNRRATLEIWEFIPPIPMTSLEGQIKDERSGNGLYSNVIIHGKEYRDSFQTNIDGSFKRNVPENAVLGIDIFAKGYFYETKMLKTQKGVTPKIELSLPKIEIGKSVDIKNIYFIGNKAILLPRSKPELPKLYQFMMLNDSIQIEIAGHVNVPFTKPELIEDKSFRLSVNRAKTIFKYLLDKGISQDRMSFKGYGNSKMRYPRATSMREQELNRRVEILILGTGKVLSAAEKK